MHTEINILEMTPPPGFEPHFRHSPLTDPWEPLYSKRTAHAVILGMYVGNAHVNARGIAHGGLISALADNAMGLSCAIQFPESPGLLTVNLNVDYMGVAKIGQWLEFSTRPSLKRARHFASRSYSSLRMPASAPKPALPLKRCGARRSDCRDLVRAFAVIHMNFSLPQEPR